MLLKLIPKLLRWYDRYDDFNIVFAAFLFTIQLAHLLWLTTNVVFPRIFNSEPFLFNHLFDSIVATVDYTEIPAIIATSLVYVRSYKKRPNRKDAFFLFFLNIQWLHIFWITDEIVVHSFGYGGFINRWNPVVAWLAIVIDYLELPVIIETVRRAVKVIVRKLA